MSSSRSTRLRSGSDVSPPITIDVNVGMGTGLIRSPTPPCGSQSPASEEARMAHGESTIQASQSPRPQRLSDQLAVDVSASARYWAPRAAIVASLITGLALAYTMPAVELADGTTLSIQEANEKLTFKGDGWVFTLMWTAVLLAIISAIVFPRSERFIQTLAVIAGSLVAMSFPFYVSRHLTLIDENATGLGYRSDRSPGSAFGVAAVLPWFSLLLVESRTYHPRPRLGEVALHAAGDALDPSLNCLPVDLCHHDEPLRFPQRRDQPVCWLGQLPAALRSRLTLARRWARRCWSEQSRRPSSWLSAPRWTDCRTRSRPGRSFGNIAGIIPISAVPAALVYLAGACSTKRWANNSMSPSSSLRCAVSIEMVLGFLIALLMNRELRARGVLRAIMTLPIFATPIAIGYLAAPSSTKRADRSTPSWKFRLNAALALRSRLGQGGDDPSSTSGSGRHSSSSLRSAGLQSLPQDVVEASEVDGANGWQRSATSRCR